MITDKLLTVDDYDVLKDSLERDEHHKETEPGFFNEPGTVCKVYEEDGRPVCFVRGQAIQNSNILYKGLRLDIQYVNNEDYKSNMKIMLWGFDRLANKAKEHGFTEVFFQSNSPLLKKFCSKRFGFLEESGGWLRKLL